MLAAGSDTWALVGSVIVSFASLFIAASVARRSTANSYTQQLETRIADNERHIAQLEARVKVCADANAALRDENLDLMKRIIQQGGH
jgi:cell division protein FtsB